MTGVFGRLYARGALLTGPSNAFSRDMNRCAIFLDDDDRHQPPSAAVARACQANTTQSRWNNGLYFFAGAEQ